MWHEGTIGIPVKDGTYKIAYYWVKAYEEGSQFGISGGKISKLTIKVDGKITANYDRGWYIPVEEGTPTEIAYAILLKDYN